MEGNPSLTLAQARSQVWKENPELERAMRELPSETRGKKVPQVSMRKGMSVLRKRDELAKEVRKADPSLTSAQARSRVWETHPELVEDYRRAQRS